MILRQSYDSSKLTVIFSEKKANLVSFNLIFRIEGVKIIQNACSTAKSSLFELSENLLQKLNISSCLGENCVQSLAFFTRYFSEFTNTANHRLRFVNHL